MGRGGVQPRLYNMIDLSAGSVPCPAPELAALELGKHVSDVGGAEIEEILHLLRVSPAGYPAISPFSTKLHLNISQPQAPTLHQPAPTRPSPLPQCNHTLTNPTPAGTCPR